MPLNTASQQLKNLFFDTIPLNIAVTEKSSKKVLLNIPHEKKLQR